MLFDIIGEIEGIETIAIGGGIHDIMRLRKMEQLFALCIENKDCEDLERRKIYQILPDAKAREEGYLRIKDESGEDYLYPESYFILVQLPNEAQEALRVGR